MCVVVQACCCLITSKAKINIFGNVVFPPQLPLGPLRSKKKQIPKTLILAFEVNTKQCGGLSKLHFFFRIQLEIWAV